MTTAPRLRYNDLLVGSAYWAACFDLGKSAQALGIVGFDQIRELTAIPENWLVLDGNRYRLNANDVQRAVSGAPEATRDEFVSDMIGR